MEHPVPRQSASWAYVFGQRGSHGVSCSRWSPGILLALLYVPSAAEAWNSLEVLNQQVTGGWFIRALHALGLEFHGHNRPDPHGPGVPFRSL
jgi:ubiquinol-cytochrome c reductase cytochrome b subunit